MPTQKLDARHLSRREVFGLRTGQCGRCGLASVPRHSCPRAGGGRQSPVSPIERPCGRTDLHVGDQAGAVDPRKESFLEEAVKACLTRIADVNPKLNAVVQLCAERALVEAKEADGLLAQGKLKGPLHGVPMTIKDSFDTAGVVSTGGTLGRKDYIPGAMPPS